MRIALITDGLGTGGAERQIVVAGAELTARGHEVALVSYNPVNHFQAAIDRQKIRLVRIDARGPLRMGRLREMAAFLKDGKFQVAHAFKESACVHGRLAAKKAGVPAIFGGYRGETRTGFAHRCLNHWLTRNTAGWIVNSEVVKRFVVRHFWLDPQGVFVVPNGLPVGITDSAKSPDQARRDLGLNPDAPVVSIVASLRPVKNHRRLLRVARHVADRVPGVVFLVVGDGAERPGLEAMARETQLESNVLFLGDRSDIGDILRATDVAVLTSDSEGMPNALIEAASAGIPCVSTDNGGASIAVRDGQTGFIVPTEDEAAFADKTLMLLQDPALRRRMGDAARQYVQHEFSAAAMGDRLLAIYSRALSGDIAGGGLP